MPCSRATSSAAVALLMGLSALAPQASAAPSIARASISADQPSAVVKVHRGYRRHSHPHYRYGAYRPRRHVVDAPFAYVESGRRVVVEAPFASVYVGRHGRHVRAPFVNLWIPY